jgi:hypothetical protein
LTQASFSFFGPQLVTAAFDDGAVTSNAGLSLLAQLDRRLGLTARLAACLQDQRDQRFVEHTVLEQFRQRVYQIACGYEDCNDADRLRADPALKVACGRHPVRDADLASQPTLSRFENERTAVEVFDLNDALVEHYVQRRKRKPAPRRIVLDLDSTEDPTHGQQELTFFHGFYDTWMYHPLLCFDGETGELLAVLLRPGNAHAAAEAVGTLRRLVRRFRAAWRGVRVLVRGDSAFGNPAMYDFCEHEGLDYVLGLQINRRLSKLTDGLAHRAAVQFEVTEEKARLFDEVKYGARTWGRERRVIIRSQVDALGRNDRFVVTSLRWASAEKVYDFYCERGDAENRIKDLKAALKADRLSCHRFVANAMRLALHAAAYVLMWELRHRLAGTDLARAQFDTLRLRLLKIGARVVTSARRIWLHMTSACPESATWMRLALRLGAETS